MAAANKILCPSCGFGNTPPLANDRCVSCGAKVDQAISRQEELAHRYEQRGFSLTWFAVSLLIMAVLTAAIVIGLPMVLPVFDFEGYAGMMVAIPVWSIAGMLVGLISPGKTFAEPVASAFLVAIPTAFFLIQSQTVKTMPYWMYILLSALGIWFTLVGAFAGERLQMGPPPKATE